MSDWTVSSTDALRISLVRAKDDQDSLAESEKDIYSFNPVFTYAVYGDEEAIYGYQDLVIDFRLTSGSLRQYLSVEYSRKLPSSSIVDDVQGTFTKFLPDLYTRDEDTFLACVEEDAATFRPFGMKVHSYTRPIFTAAEKGKGKGVASDASDDVVEFEVYHATWKTPGFREYHRRMQIFILFFIEGGSLIAEEENDWEFMVLYEKRKRKSDPNISTYHFVGYTSLYSFFCYPERVRLRLSQFLITPPYQRNGHGSELYRAVYQYVLSNPNVAELTVEDPSEAFDDLRDRNDLKMLLGLDKFMEEGFGSRSGASYGGGRVGGVGMRGKSGHAGAQMTSGKIGPPTNKAWAEKWRTQLKIASRQFQRLIEMLILLRLDTRDARAVKAYRLQVKERLYRFNYEILAQLEKEERLEKLEETFRSVKEGYSRILATVQ
ncbi:histone acetyltransferase type B [Fistulina hepatica ATCC 64428]|uniref:Histone acetyltransferase type B catalytic subunit n=1 Tax=Fistulina hepatica ATCC 64428 TaxID=1128425 RepID=A0A0D7AD60_9AGAR|nr:histone acetyltransferase type B [Fistulina hepatica ATCC 64428]